MKRDLLEERERGMEADYFRKQDAKLIEKIRDRARLQEIAQALAEKLQVDDPALLQRIADLGLTRETGAAILVVPLVQVAWADGDVTERERERVLEIAAERGVAAGTPPHDQLLAWLRQRPPVELFDTAMAALKAGYAVLPAAERSERIRELLEACKRVAEASGGGLAKLLGLQSGISDAEADVLEALMQKLRDPGAGT